LFSSCGSEKWKQSPPQVSACQPQCEENVDEKFV
jgi:hypothetical protein